MKSEKVVREELDDLPEELKLEGEDKTNPEYWRGYVDALKWVLAEY